MPKKNKPAAKGPFYFFMMEFKEQEEAAGYRFSGLAEVTEKAGPHWEKLAPHEREPYNQRAKQNKANPKEAGGYGERYTAQGKPFSQVQAEAAKRRQLEEQIQKRIVEMIQTASANNALGELEVYFVSCNYFCVSLSGEYVPAELAIIKYSLNDGVMDSLNVLINPTDLPLGMALDAKTHSSSTHQLPVPPDALGEANYEKILRQILKFFKNTSGSKVVPPIFTWNKDIPMVDSILRGILEATDLDYVKFSILPLIDFFYNLKLATEDYGLDIKTFPSIHLAKALLEKDVYAYTAGIACDVHEQLNNQVACALSRVVRWAYVISDSCCLDVGIEMEKGRHLPHNMTTLSDITGTVSALSSRMSKLTTTSDNNRSKMSRPRSTDRTDRDVTTTTIYSSRAGTVTGKPSTIVPQQPASSGGTRAANDTFNTTNPFYAMQMAQSANRSPTKKNPWSRENKLTEVRDPQSDTETSMLMLAPVAGRGRGTLARMNAAGRGRAQDLCTTVKTVGRGHLN
ncbi:maelstrom [Culex quinquefasciatus]|uniref:Protein maelstrom homolog n=1 Tax=Culex quinquefasciatus TaxID=7176 RepID=MAEL_CULQU|nr:protein maelstrom homolog [Culex quinquefasciatus]B0W2W6.1 RecName: Full=Protein maelstrom homolog [Culex quinquefasciatus]EDS30325.1 maelstrom [Culex quinquefasciatus]|eukprot:XP_001843050.1 maelstrom [Culex quinquefasciatus]